MIKLRINLLLLWSQSQCIYNRTTKMDVMGLDQISFTFFNKQPFKIKLFPSYDLHVYPIGSLNCCFIVRGRKSFLNNTVQIKFVYFYISFV